MNLKQLALKMAVWFYLHPHITRKQDLPAYIYDRIKDMRCRCPACENFKCEYCPLFSDQGVETCMFFNWFNANTEAGRTEQMGGIIQRLMSWDYYDERQKQNREAD
ncbi:MAG: hypothetical protein LBK73_12205 [Treponema sp.]|jgi:hypothetical protein|nr:hypothetical protein [Treponema sp.]